MVFVADYPCPAVPFCILRSTSPSPESCTSQFQDPFPVGAAFLFVCSRRFCISGADAFLYVFPADVRSHFRGRVATIVIKTVVLTVM